MKYEIRVQGVLDPRWSAWFEGLRVQPEGEDTLIAGPIRDQSALHGVLTRVRDLGLPLRSVLRMDPDERPTNRS